MATLAAVLLAKLSDDCKPFVRADYALEERAIIDQIYADGHISVEEHQRAWVEPQCVEHRVIHINVHNGSRGAWIEIDPIRGSVRRV